MTGDEFLELYPEGAMPQDATLIDVLETIEALIDLAERYEGLCK